MSQENGEVVRKVYEPFNRRDWDRRCLRVPATAGAMADMLDNERRNLDACMSETREYEIVLRPEPEGGFSVSVPALPGCHTQGETAEQAVAMAKDAIEGYLEVLRDEGRPPPEPGRIERVTVAA